MASFLYLAREVGGLGVAVGKEDGGAGQQDGPLYTQEETEALAGRDLLQGTCRASRVQSVSSHPHLSHLPEEDGSGTCAGN